MKLIDLDELAKHEHWSKTVRNLSCAPIVDAVPVVRCKDCKFYHTEECAMDDFHFAETKYDDFCSFGERKKEIENGKNGTI